MNCNGERIRHFRLRNNLTQNALGQMVGYPESNADVRIAQYEMRSRTPREETVKKLAQVMGVSVHALTVPEFNDLVYTLHTLFELEDMFGLAPRNIDGQLCLIVSPERCEPSRIAHSQEFALRLRDWQEQSRRMKNGEITRQQYDDWRYQYPLLCADGSQKPVEEYIRDLKYSVFPETRDKDRAQELADQVQVLTEACNALRKQLEERESAK